MLVYRIEMADGIGPYQSAGRWDIVQDFHSALCEKHANSFTHPNLMDDFGCRISDRYFCGFSCLADIQDWFHGFITKIKRAGGKIVKYEVSNTDVIFGKSGKQLVFLKNNAVKL